MKNNLRINKFFIVVAFTFSILLITSCGKDNEAYTKCLINTEYPFVLTAKYQLDTNVTVPYADVIVSVGDVLIQGKTDVSGQFEYAYNLPAIFKVYITKDTSASPLDTIIVEGNTVVTLKKDTKVYKSVFVR